MSPNTPPGFGLWFLEGALLVLASTRLSTVKYPCLFVLVSRRRRPLDPELSLNLSLLLPSTRQRLHNRSRSAPREKGVSGELHRCCEPETYRHLLYCSVSRLVPSAPGLLRAGWKSTSSTASETSTPEYPRRPQIVFELSFRRPE